LDMYLGHPGNGLYNREYHPSWPQVSPASTDYPLLAKGVLIGSLSSTLLLLTAPAENLVVLLREPSIRIKEERCPPSIKMMDELRVPLVGGALLFGRGSRRYGAPDRRSSRGCVSPSLGVGESSCVDVSISSSGLSEDLVLKNL